MIFSFLLLLILPSIINAEDSIIPIESELENQYDKPIAFRTGIHFQSSPVRQGTSLQNLLDSPSLNIEKVAIGRYGAVRLDGAATLPMFAVDGFLIRDPSINQGQISLDLLPFDFMQRADIYRQNLVPYGLNTGSMIDFRLPVFHTKKHILELQTTSPGGLYAKIQGETPFQNGTSSYGIVGDFGLHDYYFNPPENGDFQKYNDSTYNRVSFFTKTTWKNLEFLLANTFTDSFNEDPVEASCRLQRNNLITGIRFHKNIWDISANYTFYNQKAFGLKKTDSPTSTQTNDYMNHNLNISTGVSDQIGRFQYSIHGGYELRLVQDSPSAKDKNYTHAPQFGEHFFNLASEFGLFLYDPKENTKKNMDFNLSINQIITSKGQYIPVPSFTIGFQDIKGFYSAWDISRIYIFPDITSAYGFGSMPAQEQLQAKDGIRTGLELGFQNFHWNIFGNVSYTWYQNSFILTENNTMINDSAISAISTSISMGYKTYISSTIVEWKLGLAHNYEANAQGIRTLLMPMWKFTSELIFEGIDNSWHTGIYYRLIADIPYRNFQSDTIPRHYLDIKFRYRFFFINLINILNMSYRSQLGNIYSPYNPGFRTEIGIKIEI